MTFMLTMPWTINCCVQQSLAPCWVAFPTERNPLNRADPLFGIAVSAADLTGDEFSRQVLADFNSVDVLVDVSIDNKAWFPELGYVAATTHDRLKNVMNSEGYNVVSISSVCVLCCLSCVACLVLPVTNDVDIHCTSYCSDNK